MKICIFANCVRNGERIQQSIIIKWSSLLSGGVDCGGSLIIVYHFTAIVKLLQEWIFWYFGGLPPPWIQLQILPNIRGMWPSHQPPVWQPCKPFQYTSNVVSPTCCSAASISFSFGCFWSEFACFSNSHSHGNKVPLFFLPGSAYILYEGAAAA